MVSDRKNIHASPAPVSRDQEFGKIIIARYDHSHSGPWLTTTHMAYTVALVNAMQEPISGRYDWRPYTNRITHKISRKVNDETPCIDNLLHAAMMMGGFEGQVKSNLWDDLLCIFLHNRIVPEAGFALVLAFISWTAYDVIAAQC